MKVLISFLSGLIFAIGLAIGGMTDPNKVTSFLDVAGSWDPSLAFVMGGAILVYAPAYHWFSKKARPVFADLFHLPTRKDIDTRLIVGASMFGIGWGIGGFCPGPAIVSTASLRSDVLTFAAAMFVGMLCVFVFDRSRRTHS